MAIIRANFGVSPGDRTSRLQAFSVCGGNDSDELFIHPRVDRMTNFQLAKSCSPKLENVDSKLLPFPLSWTVGRLLKKCIFEKYSPDHELIIIKRYFVFVKRVVRIISKKKYRETTNIVVIDKNYANTNT